MAIVNSKTFDILEHSDITRRGYFECDETIAPVIAVLNKKGYATRNCCSGHFFDNIVCPRTPHNEWTTDEMKERFPGYMYHRKTKDGFTTIYARQNLGQRIYIQLEGYVKLPNIPKKFRYDSSADILEYDFEDDNEYQKELKENCNPYSFFLKRDCILRDLYEWAGKLPDYEDIITNENQREREFKKKTAPSIIKEFLRQFKGTDKEKARKYAEWIIVTITSRLPEGMICKGFVNIPVEEKAGYLKEKLEEYLNKKEKANE